MALGRRKNQARDDDRKADPTGSAEQPADDVDGDGPFDIEDFDNPDDAALASRRSGSAAALTVEVEVKWPYPRQTGASG